MKKSHSRRYDDIRYSELQARKDVIAAEIDIIKALGAEIKCGVEVGKDVTIDELKNRATRHFTSP